MIGELDFSGVFFSPLLFYAAIALVLSMIVRRALGFVGFYRVVWHRALFDFALFIVLWGFAAGWVGPWLEKGIWR
jgi:protein AaeX